MLAVLIEELPCSKPIRAALEALGQEGITLVVPESVIHEAVGHIERAGKTYRRFAGKLRFMSPSMVESNVWHAVVQGYYYDCQQGNETPWPVYLRKYLDRDDPVGYVRHMIESRIEYAVEPLQSIPESWLSDFEEIAAYVLESKERFRLKAEFRQDTDMEKRVRSDVLLALHLSSYATASGEGKATGYIASRDSAFEKMERHRAWKPRPRVHLPTLALTNLAEVVCAAIAPDDQIVRLLFEPVTAAVAAELESEIGLLTSYGVDLREVPLDRLDWDLRSKLRDDVRRVRDAAELPTNERLPVAMELLRALGSEGYAFQDDVNEMLDRFETVKAELSTERGERARLEEALRAVVIEGAGLSKKGRRRARHMLRELGLESQTAQPGADPPGV